MLEWVQFWLNTSFPKIVIVGRCAHEIWIRLWIPARSASEGRRMNGRRRAHPVRAPSPWSVELDSGRRHGFRGRGSEEREHCRAALLDSPKVLSATAFGTGSAKHDLDVVDRKTVAVLRRKLDSGHRVRGDVENRATGRA